MSAAWNLQKNMKKNSKKDYKELENEYLYSIGYVPAYRESYKKGKRVFSARENYKTPYVYSIIVKGTIISDGSGIISQKEFNKFLQEHKDYNFLVKRLNESKGSKIREYATDKLVEYDGWENKITQ